MREVESDNVYLLRHAFRPWLKIGIAHNVKSRMGGYRHAWGVEPFVPFVITRHVLNAIGVSARQMELALLRRFSRDAVGGEWVRLSDDVRRMERVASELTQRDKEKAKAFWSFVNPAAFPIIEKLPPVILTGPSSRLYYRGVSPKI
jgi:hypothetical protein